MRPAALAALAAVLACAPALVRPGPREVEAARARWPGTTLEDLQRGRASYAARCSECHAPRLPQSVRAGRWPALLEAMDEKARLEPGEREAITRFLVAASEAAAR